MSVRPVKVKPLGARVLSRLLPPESLSAIIFVPHMKDEERPGSASFRSKPAVVVAVGPGWTQDDGSVVPLGVKPGDEILLPMYPGVAVPEIGFDTEKNEVVEIRDSRLSGLMMTPYKDIVVLRQK